MCIFLTLIFWKFKWNFFNFSLTTKFRALLSLSLHSSPSSSKFLSVASYGGELLPDSSSPWSGISSLPSFSIPLPSDLKKQRNPLMKKIQGLVAPRSLHHVVSRASSSRWCSFASSIFLFGEFFLIPCSSSYSPCISSILLWLGVV